MKLRNKKTGEIGLLLYTSSYDGSVIIQDINAKDNCEYIAKYHSLAELNDDWEDYEEPKDNWWIDVDGGVCHATGEADDYFEKNREIDNYFETKEEAEKAVEKLKAWKRLKDAGFEFRGIDWKDRGSIGDFEIYAHADGEILLLDLTLLFGGEE